MNISRNKLQEIAMISIYNALIYADMDLEIDIEKTLCNLVESSYEEVDSFLKEMLIKTLKYKEENVNDLQKNMINWTFNRLNRLTQAILLLALTQYRFVEKVDKKIVINNAIKLGKKFLDNGDYKFINAVLDKTL